MGAEVLMGTKCSWWKNIKRKETEPKKHDRVIDNIKLGIREDSLMEKD
jgi:hypothetical protein